METTYAVESGGHFAKLRLMFKEYESEHSAIIGCVQEEYKERHKLQLAAWTVAIESELQLIAKLGAIYAVKEKLPLPEDF